MFTAAAPLYMYANSDCRATVASNAAASPTLGRVSGTVQALSSYFGLFKHKTKQPPQKKIPRPVKHEESLLISPHHGIPPLKNTCIVELPLAQTPAGKKERNSPTQSTSPNDIQRSNHKSKEKGSRSQRNMCNVGWPLTVANVTAVIPYEHADH